MAGIKGQRIGGRQKGTPNKTTTQLKEAILGAFDKLGGMNYLVGVGQDNPQIFCTLLGKVLPMTLAGQDGGDITFVIKTGVDRGAPST